MRRKPVRLRVVLCAVALAGLVPLAASGSSASGGPGGSRYENVRYGFWVPVPSGWHRSRARLVPKLLDPREIVSLGNFAMPVGGGGNCGREPSAAIAAMGPGDALVTVQEVEVPPKLRSHLRRNFPARPNRLGLGELRRAFPAESKTSGPMRYGKLAFSDRGRAFEALFYLDGPTARGLREVDSILSRLRFQPGSWRHFHGAESAATAA